MSDITGALKRAVAAALRGDAAVVAAFHGSPVRILDIPRPNEQPPYFTLGPGRVSPIAAEGFELSEIDYPVHFWSLTSPPSTDQADEIARAARGALADVTVSANGRVYAIVSGVTETLIDPSDGRSVHVVIANTFTTAPA